MTKKYKACGRGYQNGGGCREENGRSGGEIIKNEESKRTGSRTYTCKYFVERKLLNGEKRQQNQRKYKLGEVRRI